MSLWFKNNCCQKKAFTLAETLITLGIIAIIAAITIPSLIVQYQKAQTLNQLKSVYAILNTAIEQAGIDNGTDVNLWYVPNTSNTIASTYFAQNYLLPYLKASETCGSSTASECLHNVGNLLNLTTDPKTYQTISGNSSCYSFKLINGAIVCVQVFSLSGTKISDCRVQLIFDINGNDLPNIKGKDTFVVELGGNFTTDRNKFYPYASSYTRDMLINSGNGTDCNKSSGTGERCFALIVKDGWTIADDYPW